MPGKQMAIDADLNAGLITQEQAVARRNEVSQEADFYGAMDGASKFIRGDAVAGILILVINVLGGLVIGTLDHGKERLAADHRPVAQFRLLETPRRHRRKRAAQHPRADDRRRRSVLAGMPNARARHGRHWLEQRRQRRRRRKSKRRRSPFPQRSGRLGRRPR
jgi:hypothetical protein